MRRYRIGRGLLNAILITVFSNVAYAYDCNPVHLNHCAMPFPSDFFTAEDAGSPTGKRIVVPDNLFPANALAELPPTIQPSLIYKNASGFSAASAVVFEVPAKPEKDVSAAAVAVDLDTGELFPLDAQPSIVARSHYLPAAKRADIIELWPRARWQFGHRYAAALTSALKTADGKPMPSIASFTDVLAGKNPAIASAFEETFLALEKHGIPRSELLDATFFTVRTEQEVTSPMRHWAETAYSQPHPIKDLHVQYYKYGTVAAIVTGQVRLTNFRDQYGGMRFEENDLGDDYWSKIILYLPRLAKGEKAPVAIYGHGLSIWAETALVTVVPKNAAHHIATVAINQPNHGDRASKDGGYVFSILQPKNVARITGLVMQSPIDFVSVVKAIESSLNTLDVLPAVKNAQSGPIGLQGADGVADLDTSRIFYQGTSLGGVLGLTFLSVTPSVKSSFLQVPGVGITHILSQSILMEQSELPLPGFGLLVPKNAGGADAAVLFAGVQQMLDYGDAINFVQYLRKPLPGNEIRPVALTYGLGDRIVTNASTQALMEIADIPLLPPVYKPMPAIRSVSDLEEEGFGAIEVKPLLPQTPDITGHLSFLNLSAQAMFTRWVNFAQTQP